MPPLKNHRHEQFGKKYVGLRGQKGAGMRALRAAGYNATTDGSASAQASALLKTPKVAKRLLELNERIADRVVADKERVLKELSRVALSDIRKVLDADGNFKNPQEWDDDTAAAVAGLKRNEIVIGRGKQKQVVGHTLELKQWSKHSALETLARHFKIIDDDLSKANGVTVNVNFYLPEKDHVSSNGHADPILVNG